MDLKATQARRLHRRACESARQSKQWREQRDQLVKQLRAEDSRQWTYENLARAVGCSSELIAAIIKDRRNSSTHKAS